MRFLLDMGISPRVSQFLRDQQHDAIHDYALDLERGAIISLSDRRIRVRALPITAFPPRR